MWKAVRIIYAPVLVVFMAVMLLVGISYVMARNTVRREVSNNVTSYIEASENSMRQRLDIFQVTLHAGIGLVSSNPTLTQQTWQGFISDAQVLAEHSSAQAVNYARVVPADQLEGYIAEMRPRTVPEFHLSPAGERSQYALLTYMAPFKQSSVQYFGYDLTSDPSRNQVIALARDSGQVVLSGLVQSLIDKSEEGRLFIMMVPQYKKGAPTATVEERQQAVEGYVYTVFRVNTFIANSIPRQNSENIAFTITTRETHSEFYRSHNYDSIMKGSHETRSSSLKIGGSTLDIAYAYNPQTIIPSYAASRPLAILVFGSITAFLIAFTIFLMLRAKSNELLLEQERGINEAKDSLLSLASHQLRTPATGVKQYLGLILQGFAGDVSARQRNILEKAYAGNERQLKTINDVLYLARLGSGRIVLAKTTFSVEQLVRDIVRELDSEITDKQHKISLKLPKRSREFTGDEHMIRMAIENLLTNAIKYTRLKGRIEVGVSYISDALRITVKDSGLGIPKDQQERMFQQFVRLENELSVSVGGTGIGLYVVKHIAELHDGTVTVVSEINKGSTFTLLLPYDAKRKMHKSVK